MSGRPRLEQLAAIFEEQRHDFAGQWRDGEPDTEELRLTLRRYREPATCRRKYPGAITGRHRDVELGRELDQTVTD